MATLENFKIWIKRLQSFADRPWYFPVLGILAGLDLFILVVPTDALLVSSVILQPRRWVSAFVWIGLGAAVGALVLAGVVQWEGPHAMQIWFPESFNSSSWQMVQGFIDRWGLVALFLLAASPLVQFPAVAVAALSGMALTKIFLVCLLGRSLKAAVISYLASHAPALLMRLPFLKEELAFLELETRKKKSRAASR